MGAFGNVFESDNWHHDAKSIAVRNGIKTRRWGMRVTVYLGASAGDYVLSYNLVNTNIQSNANWLKVANIGATWGGGGGGGITSLQNGLNEFSAGVGELGGPLVRNTSITGAGVYQLSIDAQTLTLNSDVNTNLQSNKNVTIGAGNIDPTGVLYMYGPSAYLFGTDLIDLTSTTQLNMTADVFVSIDTADMEVNATGTISNSSEFYDVLANQLITLNSFDAIDITASGSLSLTGTDDVIINGYDSVSIAGINLLQLQATAQINVQASGISIQGSVGVQMQAGLGTQVPFFYLDSDGSGIFSAKGAFMLAGDKLMVDPFGLISIFDDGTMDFTAAGFSLNGSFPVSPTTEFFRGDGTWAVPAGGGGVNFGTAMQIPYMNGTDDNFDYEAGFEYDQSNDRLQVNNIRLGSTSIAGNRVIDFASSDASGVLLVGNASGNFGTIRFVESLTDVQMYSGLSVLTSSALTTVAGYTGGHTTLGAVTNGFWSNSTHGIHTVVGNGTGVQAIFRGGDVTASTGQAATTGNVLITPGVNSNGTSNGDISSGHVLINIPAPFNAGTYGNVAFFNSTYASAPNFQSGQKIIYLGDAVATPSGNPVGGGYLYSEAGALKWRGSAGTVTTIAPA